MACVQSKSMDYKTEPVSPWDGMRLLQSTDYKQGACKSLCEGMSPWKEPIKDPWKEDL